MKINITGEKAIQSPHVYLQSAGSTGADGTVEGYHLRWAFLNALGENHLPKGNDSTTSHAFNRNDDFVRVYKVPYRSKFQTTINVAEAIPSGIVNRNDKRVWVYVETGTTPIYLHFKDVSAYDNIAIDPKVDPKGFIAAYGEGLLEVEAKDELFFAAEIEVEGEVATTLIKTEAISKRENKPLGEKYISCRKTFDATAIIDAQAKDGDSVLLAENEDFLKTEAVEGILLQEGTPHGCNLLQNPSFEEGNIGFESGYNFSSGAAVGNYWITNDASSVNGGWNGLPHRGSNMVTFDGSSNLMVWKQSNVPVRTGTDYTFEGWFANLFSSSPVKLTLTVEGDQDGVIGTFDLDMVGSPVGEWVNLKQVINSGNSTTITLIITNDETVPVGSDFAIDNFAFYETTFSPFSGVRIKSENMTSVRFTIKDADLLNIKLETYTDFYEGVNNAEFWESLGQHSLSTNDQTVFDALEKSSDFTINNSWPKFNDGAFVKTQNYIDKWNNAGGLKEGVSDFISLSNDTIANPKGIKTLQEDGGQEDDTIDVSYLDMLNIASVDFHVARMLGLGKIDADSNELDENEYVFLMHYVTEGDIEDGGGARRVEHFFMTPPTSKLESKLPDPISLKDVEYGLEVSNGTDEPIILTELDENGNHTGYTPDHKSRFIRIKMDPTDPNTGLGDFYASPLEFCTIDKTSATMLGLEYRDFGSSWVLPELAHEENYTDTIGNGETVLIPTRTDDKPVYIHRETTPGVHEYSAYGVNWFSRASGLGNIVATDHTEFIANNTLLPPSNFKVQLVQEESPRYFTTLAEQSLLDANINSDKTLVRVTFDYNHVHDRAYSYFNQTTSNWEFGNVVELFFRKTKPRIVKGAVKSLVQNDSDFFTISTRSYTQTSNGETVSPDVDASLYGNYIGGVFVINDERYIIEDVLVGGAGEGPQFKLHIKKEKTPVDETSNDVVYKPILPENAEGAFFTAIENMASASNWHDGSTSNGDIPQKLATTIQIGDGWTPVDETIKVNDLGETETKTLRGVWDNGATITAETETVDDPNNEGQTIEKHLGVYKIELSQTLTQHPQSTASNPVFWEGGVIRVPQNVETNGSAPEFDKIPLEVIKIENVGTANNLIVYAYNPAFDGVGTADNQVKTGAGNQVNYYPGYKAYLYVDNSANFNELNILPAEDEGSRTTYLGTRSKANGQNFHSNMSPGQIIFARELKEPGIPQQPLGPLYATRPDFYDKSTYTFSVEFDNKPFSVVFFRANERSILGALYEQSTVDTIISALPHRTKDEFYTSRWRDLLDFFNDQDNPPTGQTTFTEINGYTFPNPDKVSLFDNPSDAGTIAVGDASLYAKARAEFILAFTPICEQAILWEFINGSEYTPVNKKQVFRDSDGNVLPPTHPEFDPAPMVKKLADADYKLQFTDFTLDGSSDEAYFYLGREINAQMKMGGISPIAGPIQLINSTPATPPKVVKVTTQLADIAAETESAINFEVTEYAETEKITGFAIYRTNSANKALTPRSMDLVKTIELSDSESYTIDNNVIKFADDFEGEEFLPYGEPLFYKLVALREIQYEEDGALVIDVAPSKPSKLLMSNLVDTVNPEAPIIKVTGDLSGDEQSFENVKLSWKKTVHNGTYRIYKMNSVGNWEKLGEIVRENGDLVEFDLVDSLARFDEDSNNIYHRFKIDVENSSGLLNLAERPITVVTGANDLLQQLEDFIEIMDDIHSYFPEDSMLIDPSIEYAGSLTFTDTIGDMILGHTYDKVEVTVNDSLGGTVTKLLPQDGSVTFNQLDGLQVDNTILNITYDVEVKIFTDLATNGVSFNYSLQYGPCNALIDLESIVDLQDGNNEVISPLISQAIDQQFPTTLTFTDVVDVPAGQIYDHTDITVTDDIGNTFSKPINSPGGSIAFVQGEGGLELDNSNPNRSYTINVKLFTDKCPDGYEYEYFISYVGA